MVTAESQCAWSSGHRKSYTLRNGRNCLFFTLCTFYHGRKGKGRGGEGRVGEGRGEEIRREGAREGGRERGKNQESLIQYG